MPKTEANNNSGGEGDGRLMSLVTFDFRTLNFLFAFFFGTHFVDDENRSPTLSFHNNNINTIQIYDFPKHFTTTNFGRE